MESDRVVQARDSSAEYDLARPQNLMNISSRTSWECTRQTVKRVPISEQKRANLVRSFQGTPWDRLAGRPAGRPRRTAPQATPVATPPVAKETERPSENADERDSCRPSPSRSRHRERTNVIVIQTNGDRRPGAPVTTQPATKPLKLRFQFQTIRWNRQTQLADSP